MSRTSSFCKKGKKCAWEAKIKAGKRQPELPPDGEKWKQKTTGRGCDSIAMRIGLNSGPAVVGNMGSSRRFDYTAMGDTINLAARLEGACKQYGIQILVGEETYRRVQDDVVGREVDIIRVVGKMKPVAVYEIMALKAEAGADEAARLTLYGEAREAYKRREWDKAAELFGRVQGDPLSSLYTERCLILKQAPPPEEWDGVFTLKIK